MSIKYNEMTDTQLFYYWVEKFDLTPPASDRAAILEHLAKISASDKLLICDVLGEIDVKTQELMAHQKQTNKSDDEIGKLLIKETLYWVVSNPIKVSRLAWMVYQTL